MIPAVKNDNEQPICPHCKVRLPEVQFQELDKDLGKRCLYFCPQCRAVLGISHRKGLTFGW